MRAARAATAALLVAATMVIGTTVLPTTDATTAQAAPNFDPTTLYITSRSGTAQAPTNYPIISSVDRDTGVTASAYTVPSPTGVFNQLALSPGGAQMFWTNGGAADSRIYEYTPGGAAAPVLESIVRPAAAVGNTMGGFNPANGLYYFGGFSNGSLVLSTYNPVSNTVSANTNTFSFATAPPGENGDIAFGRTGNLFFVAGGATSGQIYRVPAAAGTTAPPATAAASPLGSVFSGPGNVNSIAFGGDGYLYVYASAGTVGLTQVNPTSGAIIDTVQITGAAANVTDLASAATPSSISGQVTLPGGRIAAGDQFTTTISGTDVPTGANAPTGTTAGAETGLQNQQPAEISGPQLTLPQTSYTVTQTAAGTTNLAQYLTTWQCVNAATGTALSSGSGQVASATIPAGANGTPVVCTFTNTPGTASIFVDKTTTTTAVTAIGQTITYSYLIRNTGTLTATNVTLADPMPGLTGLTCAAPGQGGTLAPNATMTCTATRTATAADFSSGTGTLDNTATVTASTARGTVTGTDVVQLPVDRTAPTPAPDSSVGNVIGQPVTVPTVANDGTVVASSVRIQPPGGAPAATSYTAPGQGTWTVNTTTGAITFTPQAGFTGDPTPIAYSVAKANGLRGSSTVTVDYAPGAVDDTSTGNTIGQPVTQSVLANDQGGLVPASVALIDPATGTPLAAGASLTVAGQGVWSIAPTTGAITFTPAAGYEGDPTPVRYRATDAQGNATSALVTVRYTPVGVDDLSQGNPAGQPVSLDVLTNDLGVFQGGTFRFVDPATGTPLAPLAPLTVPGQGTWSVNGAGIVTFTPAAGFLTSPTPVGYRVTGNGGTVVAATITVRVAPLAVNDQDLGNTIGDDVRVDVLANDAGTLNPATVAILNPATGTYLADGAPLVVAGQGTWSIAAATGAITFSPVDGFLVDPTPITYRVANDRGERASATVTVTYVPSAADDVADDVTAGQPSVVEPLANDTGDFDESTLAFVDPATGAPLAPLAPLTIAGQGTWSVADGVVTFTPEAGFEGDPSPVDYRVADVTGDVVGATISANVVPLAADDADVDNALGDAVTQDVLANDLGVLDVATLALVDADGETLDAGASLVVDGEGTWSIAGSTITFTPEEGFLGDPTPIRYEVADLSGDVTSAEVVVGYVGVAQDDADLGNAIGDAVTVPVLDNDLGVFDPETVAFVDPETGEALEAGAELVVAGEGTWTIDPATGDVTFTPEDGFEGDPTVVTYQVADLSGDVSQATITITYLPVAVDDEDLGNPIGTAVGVDVLANDAGVFDVASLSLVAADDTVLAPGAPLVVAGEGTWSIAGSTVTFTPEAGYEGDPTPVRYQVTDLSGDVTGASITVDYVSVANDDVDVDNAIGTAVPVDVLANDQGDFDVASLSLVDADGTVLAPGAQLIVDGEGVWTVAGSVVSFTPARGFLGDPTPIDYEITDRSGDTRSATITVGYVGVAIADVDEGNFVGDAVTLPILDNDRGVFDPATVAFLDPATGEVLEAGAALVVAGQGTWTIDPDTGDVTFTPEVGYEGDPTVVTYQVADLSGDVSRATITVTYIPATIADVDEGNTIGEAVSIDVLENDLGIFDPARVSLIDPATGVTLAPGAPLTVAGEGVWTIDAATAVVTFTPEAGYEGDPTVVSYSVPDNAGLVNTATITITYLPVAADDSALDNVVGTAVSIDVLANDAGVFALVTLALVDADGTVLAPGAALTVPGEGVWSIDGSTVTFTPEAGYEGDPTPIAYEVVDLSGDVTGASITVTYLGDAQDDVDLGNTIGDAVTVPALDNDLGILDPATVAFIGADGQPLAPGAELVVEGQGTWTIDTETGDVTFTPADGFEGDPTVVTYQVASERGSISTATITITYLPVAEDDADLDNVVGEAVAQDVLANDAGVFDVASLSLVAADDTVLAPGAPLAVDGEGTWTIDGSTVTFTPAEGFQGDPTPIRYRVTDLSGDVTSAEVAVGYVGDAQDDADLGNAIGDAVTVPVLANDLGVFDPATIAFLDPETGDALEAGAELVVDGEGTWSIDPETGDVTFTPEDGFEGDPTVVTYEVADLSGDVSQATITITYLPVAVDDADVDNVVGDAVALDVLANDAGVFDEATLSLVAADGTVLDAGAPLVVAGEGTWSIDGPTVTFTPEEGFQGDPTPIRYQVADLSGDLTSAAIVVGYVGAAVDDERLGNAIGAVVAIDVLANDAGVFDVASLSLVAADGTVLGAGEPLVVEGEGTWSIEGSTVTFTPAEGFEGDPTPIAYEVTDLSGDVTGASITVGYVPVAADDADVDNVPGTAVPVDVLANDAGVLDVASLSLVDADGSVLDAGESLVVDGEGTWSIEGSVVTFTPEVGFRGDPTPIRYEVADRSGDRTQASITVGYVGAAQADSDLGNVIGDAVTVPVLDNDLGAFDPATVAFLDPATGEALDAGAELVVDGEGTWSIDPATGDVTFTPADGFEGDPTVVTYRVADLSGDLSDATITITYLPVAADDADLDNTVGSPVTIDVLANDAGVLDPATLALVDADGTTLAAGESLVVDGEGTWSIDGSTVTFTPEEGFQGDPTPIRYEVADRSGDVTGASVAVGYVGVAVDDVDVDNVVGDAVAIDVLANDAGAFDVASLALVDADGTVLGAGESLVVDGEGVWSIDGSTVTFTPEEGFQGDPTPIGYLVFDLSGDVTGAAIVVGYVGVAQDDEELGAVIGAPVAVDVLANDVGVFDPATITLVDPATGEALAPGAPLTVVGEGVWTIDGSTVTFTPEAGFEGNPTVVTYRVADLSGDASSATITITVVSVANDDADVDNVVGEAVPIDVLANDAGAFDVASLSLVDADGTVLDAGEPLVVAGEGTWSIDGSVVTFTPEEGFQGDPTPIAYEVTDLDGDVVTASITVGYVGDAQDDADLGNAIGDAVTVPVLDNDLGEFDPATVAFLDPATGEALEAGAELVVDGEG
ncbi:MULTISPECIES: Ig-like domain-containing protein, partial [unclassified Agrococcus]|uniref:Ig-like domain-containing protein n=1 Tax=unclassified Agrococcus TaxID=2615065 RepID=UPI003615A999